MSHSAFMHRCLELASRGRGRVGNGALVGAVLARGGKVLAEAFHALYGGPHAERALLEAYKTSIQAEDILYVSLEPCCHHGKTPPCTDIIIERGIRTVVYGMHDPDPRVCGQGVEILRKAGLRVIGPVERARCEYFNRGFMSVRRYSRPHVTFKMALDRAGRISMDDGSPSKITSGEQDAWSHQMLRGRHDAILCGIGTVETDNPLLNIRFDQKGILYLTEGLNENINGNENFFEPYKIVLDPSGRIDPTVNVAALHPDRLILCIGEGVGERRASALSLLHRQGVRICRLPLQNGVFAWNALWRALIEPDEQFHGITSILVEGGRRTWDAFRSAGMVDEEVILIGAAS